MKERILQDWDANAGNAKSRLVLVLFRLAQEVRTWSGPARWAGVPLAALYYLLVEWGLGIELNPKSRIGSALRIYHGVGLVIHEGAVIGKNCILRQSTTIGAKTGPDDCPVLGDGVDVGAHAVLLGRIHIGSGARIGAGSVVVRDVAPGDTVAGNPARPLTSAGSP